MPSTAESKAKRTNPKTANKGSDDRTTTPPMADPSPTTYVLLAIALITTLTALALSIVALAIENDHGSNRSGRSTTHNSTSTSENVTSSFASLLDEVYQRGFLRCGMGSVQHPGFFFEINGGDESSSPRYAGIDYQLCRILSGAIFGAVVGEEDGEARDTYYELINVGFGERWQALQSGQVDVVFRTSHTMERDVYMAEVGTGFAFGTPYFYDGVSVGGLPEYVECVENGNFNETTICGDVRICVWEGTSLVDTVRSLVPSDDHVVLVPPNANPNDFFPEECQTVGGLRSGIAEAVLRQLGYEGPYVLGTQLYSLDPLCIVSREDDSLWTDFVELALQSLIFAEENGITKATASEMPTTDLFGPRFELMLQHVVAVAGNYGEVYVNNVEAFLPRKGLNELNQGAYPRLLSSPFGNLDTVGPQIELISPTVQAIRERGHLRCGQVLIPGLISFVPQTGSFAGLQADLCRAISAALFDGVDRTLFVTTTFPNRFGLLKDDKFDVLMSTSKTLTRDVRVDSIGEGLTFSEPYFFLGFLFAGREPYVDCAERLDVISPECQDLRVCTFTGTTFFEQFADVLRENYVESVSTLEEQALGLRDGRCNAILGDVTAVQEASVRANGYGENLPYVLGTRVFSVEHFALTTLQGDPAWSDFLNWIFIALVYAEENNIDQASASLMPRTNLFGSLRTDAFYHAVNMVGNYGELYNRNIGSVLPRTAILMLNNSTQPRLYSFPGI